MSKSTVAKNKASFWKRSKPCSISAITRRGKEFWSPNYIQHSAQLLRGATGSWTHQKVFRTR